MVDPPDICGFSQFQVTPKNPIEEVKNYGKKPNNHFAILNRNSNESHRVNNDSPSYKRHVSSHVHRHTQRSLFTSLALIGLLLCLLPSFLCSQVSGHALPSYQSGSTGPGNSIHSQTIPNPPNAALFSSYDPSSRNNNAVSLENWSSMTKAFKKNGFLTIFSNEPKKSNPYGLTENTSPSLFDPPSMRVFKRSSSCETEHPMPEGQKIGYGILVPILVLLSGVFAGLTLGYMSLDETQLQVLMTTGDEKQRERAKKIMPIRKDGHLLLTTLLIANMITNETLPIIFDPLLKGGATSVVVSTVLIVIFSELIPQSTCSRYGLQIGAVMAFPTRIIILIFWPIAFPVSRILHWTLGPHHGIVYRRAELKELVTMHAASGGRGGDLNRDTVMIVGGALDLQEKVVKQAMTPIDKVFMLPFTAKLDYPTLERVVRSGHSRIPIYQEVEVSVSQSRSGTNTPRKKLNLLSPFTRKSTVDENNPDSKGALVSDADQTGKTVIRKKIIGTLLVKACVLLDPEDAVPVSSMIINALPTVPGDEPLLNVLNVFQEGRSHMAIVSPRPRRGLNESVSDLGSKTHLYHSSHGPGGLISSSAAPRVDGLGNIDEEKNIEGTQGSASRTSNSSGSDSGSTGETKSNSRHKSKGWRSRLGLRNGEKDLLEQSIPSDAIIGEDEKAQQKALELGASNTVLNLNTNELTKVDSRVSFAHEEGDNQPIGIITLEDVLEELLCEEILDEYDDRGNEEEDFRTYIPPPSPDKPFKVENQEKKQTDGNQGILDVETGNKADVERKNPMSVGLTPPVTPGVALPKKTVLGRLGINRQKSTKQGDEDVTGVGVDGVNRKTTDKNASVDVSVPQSEAATPMERGRKIESNDNSDDNYFTGVTTASALPRPIRSLSMPPEGEGNARQEGVGEKHILLPEPAIGMGKGNVIDSTITTPFGGQIVTTPPPLSPTSSTGSKPVLVRAQMPGGPQKTVIASESLLRGRQMRGSQTHASGMGVGTGIGEMAVQPQSGAVLIGGNALTPVTTSRSATPVGGNRGNRFKSQAAAGFGGNISGSVIVQQQQQQQQRTRSLATAISTIAPNTSQPTTQPPSPTTESAPEKAQQQTEQEQSQPK